jgi:hypothetical protein
MMFICYIFHGVGIEMKYLPFVDTKPRPLGQKIRKVPKTLRRPDRTIHREKVAQRTAASSTLRKIQPACPTMNI